MIVQYVPNIHAKLFGREFIMLKLLKKVTISANKIDAHPP